MGLQERNKQRRTNASRMLHGMSYAYQIKSNCFCGCYCDSSPCKTGPSYNVTSSHVSCSYSLHQYPIPPLLAFSAPAKTILFTRNHKPFRGAASSASASASATTSSNNETVPKSAIQRIAEKLRSLGFAEESRRSNNALIDDDSKIGEIFIPNSQHLPKYRVGHTLDQSWSTPQNPVPDPGTGRAIAKLHELRNEAVREKRELKEKEKREKRAPTLAELKMPADEVRRLTTIGIKLKKKLKIGKAGITEGIINGIHERWRRSEVVKIACEDICKMNMKRTHDLLERKTGGVIVWRAGSKIVLYRGVNYKYPYFTIEEASAASQNMADDEGVQCRDESYPSGTDVVKSPGSTMTRRLVQSSLIQGVGCPNRVRFQLPGEEQLVEEADRLLDGLGPRFTDWWGCDPLPVDADLLPAVVPGHRRPFRLLPYGVKPKLTNDEMTVLKRLGRPLPCHFALGRNRNLQGLAAAVIKLWEKCEIAKIAVKRGVQNTSSKMMAEELKRLTGGTLLSRDKEFIVFYRGKDFLPLAVSLAIEERRRSQTRGDEQWIYRDPSMITLKDSVIVTSENASAGKSGMTNDRNMDSEERKMKTIETEVKKTGLKLSVAIEKKKRAEKLLAELEQTEIPHQMEVDREGITEEERYMLRKVGLRMKPFLLLGRRGVFDGTVENMHLHWKYRELVKIICGGKSIMEVHRVAQMLEAESGGILVAVERVSKGYAIIVYRGKNYQRPSCLRPKTLLNKKQAMRHSLEAQRCESLKLHVLKLTRDVEELESTLVKDKETFSSLPDDPLKTHLVAKDAELTTTLSNNRTNPRKDNPKVIHQEQINASSIYGDENSEAAMNPPSVSACVDSHGVMDLVSYGGLDSVDHHDDSETSCSALVHSTSHNFEDDSSDSSLVSTYHELEPSVHAASQDDLKHHFLNNEIMERGSQSAEIESMPPCHEAAPYASNEVRPRAAPLSNKERLLLRKQALKMKRRPVLAVGRSNIITGVAKTIKEHFKKHPLAIVNVKGRAKGTSVLEVVFKLEQATGGVLVSQEPSKVILYRGWGAGLETGCAITRKENADNGEGLRQPAVSPELMEAMKLECGLPSNETQEI
ncbi:hypothetical protein Nepgr_006365 [Nepenthes gracilis]|uniref:CRM domain-containing protein n=1 Tax=Nepenthes gracilis TaxID=150966 RepID=A0AAD3S509_NEPGR|nr:hypothetical protein Nepgr_006365 [Nepenthes gracilis]